MCGDVLAQIARLADVLGCDPEVGAVKNGRPVIAPAGAGRVRRVEDSGAAEAVRRAGARGRDLNLRGAGGAYRGEGRARVEVTTDEREGHDAVPVRGDGDGGIGDVVLADREVAAVDERARGRVDDEPLDSRPRIGGRVDGGVERAPQLAVAEHDLLHARVVSFDPGIGLGCARTPSGEPEFWVADRLVRPVD